MKKPANLAIGCFNRWLILVLSTLCPYTAVSADSAASAFYLANEGVMVVHGETKILFDPLFNNAYGRYELLPGEMKDALFAGEPPFDGVDAVFVSHFHGDHFSPAEMLAFLKLRRDIRLYAPEQAVSAMRNLASADDASVFERITSFDLAYGDDPITLFEGQAGSETGAPHEAQLSIDVAYLPHSGWPKSMLDVQNLSFRVTLNDATTVLHMGDADTKDAHFQPHAAYWQRHIDVAFPPYWYFSSSNGRYVLENRLKPDLSIGIHVPKEMPDKAQDRPEAYQGYDLFTIPGETREITDIEGTQ